MILLKEVHLLWLTSASILADQGLGQVEELVFSLGALLSIPTHTPMFHQHITK